MFPLNTIICDRLQLERETTTSATSSADTFGSAGSDHAIPFTKSSCDSVGNMTADTEDCSTIGPTTRTCRSNSMVSLSSASTVVTQPKVPRPSTKKTVRFATRATVRPIGRMDLDTHGHLWHSDAERAINEQEMVSHVKNFRRKSPQEQQECISHDNMRGLEQFTSASAMKQLRVERRTLMLAVLKAQEGQRKQPAKQQLGIEARTKLHLVEENALDLALVSAALSLPARKRALALGIQDAEDQTLP